MQAFKPDYYTIEPLNNNNSKQTNEQNKEVREIVSAILRDLLLWELRLSRYSATIKKDY